MAGLARAGGKTRVSDLLVLDNEVLQHALLGSDLVHGVEVDLAKLLDVEGATILCRCQLLDGSMFGCYVVAHLVGLVVVLRVVLENLSLLLVLKGLQQLVDTTTELLSPLLAVDEPVTHVSALILPLIDMR